MFPRKRAAAGLPLTAADAGATPGYRVSMAATRRRAGSAAVGPASLSLRAVILLSLAIGCLLALLLWTVSSGALLHASPPPLPEEGVVQLSAEPAEAAQLAAASDAAPVCSGSVEQVHITHRGMRAESMWVSWLTIDSACNRMRFQESQLARGGASNGSWTLLTAEESSYRRADYSSSAIMHASTPMLRAGISYTYQLGRPGDWGDEQSFTTPPAVSFRTAYRFVLTGDVGQSDNSRKTIARIAQLREEKPMSVLYVGDLSYADGDQLLWDSWGRVSQPLFSHTPVLTTVGNHEEERWAGAPWLAYRSRYRTPVDGNAAAAAALFYSIRIGPAHIFALCSDCRGRDAAEQDRWLQRELSNVDRRVTPWLLVFMHVPLYNSNWAHFHEAEKKRKQWEPLFVRAQVDAVFAGHVHAYERSVAVVNKQSSSAGPVYFTVGAGGNKEGLFTKWHKQPAWSARRLSQSYGFGVLDVVNGTHAQWRWLTHDMPLQTASPSDSTWLTHPEGFGLLLHAASHAKKHDDAAD